MININPKGKPVDLNRLEVGGWYILENGDLVNYEGYVNDKPTFITFRDKRRFPFLSEFDSSSDMKFTPVNVRIDIEWVNK